MVKIDVSNGKLAGKADSQRKTNQIALEFFWNSLRILLLSAPLIRVQLDKSANKRMFSALTCFFFCFFLDRIILILHMLFLNFSGWNFVREAESSEYFKNFN